MIRLQDMCHKYGNVKLNFKKMDNGYFHTTFTPVNRGVYLEAYIKSGEPMIFLHKEKRCLKAKDGETICEVCTDDCPYGLRG